MKEGKKEGMKEGKKENDKKKKKRKKPVIQGSHMVSGTRCPAWSDPVKKWSESRVAALKGHGPVEHRSEFPDVLKGYISGLR